MRIWSRSLDRDDLHSPKTLSNYLKQMIKYSTLLLLLSAVAPAMGQCTVAIPANAVAVTTLQGSTPANGQFIWVCSGGLAAVTGNGNTVFVEEQGVGSVIGDNNILITKVSSTYVSGNNNSVFILDAAGVADLGTGTQITTCPSIVFTYANAPANGCLDVGIVDLNTTVSFELFPNPVGRVLNLVIEGATIERVRVFDAQGHVAIDRTGPVNGKMNVEDLTSGLYLLVADTDHGPLVRQLLKD